MGRTRKKKCKFCGVWFYPHPRSKGRQVHCGAPSCKKQRKQQTQRNWQQKNPTYFHGRYENTKEWLSRHPGYLKEYRRTHLNYEQNNRDQQKKRDQKGRESNLDIQDTIKLQDLSYQRDTHKVADLDIQDPLLPYPELFLGLMSCLRHLDIQDPIGISLHSIYNRGRFLFNRYVDLRKEGSWS